MVLIKRPRFCSFFFKSRVGIRSHFFASDPQCPRLSNSFAKRTRRRMRRTFRPRDLQCSIPNAIRQGENGSINSIQLYTCKHPMSLIPSATQMNKSSDSDVKFSCPLTPVIWFKCPWVKVWSWLRTFSRFLGTWHQDTMHLTVHCSYFAVLRSHWNLVILSYPSPRPCTMQSYICAKGATKVVVSSLAVKTHQKLVRKRKWV